jgi:hypothetical protein
LIGPKKNSKLVVSGSVAVSPERMAGGHKMYAIVASNHTGIDADGVMLPIMTATTYPSTAHMKLVSTARFMSAILSGP